MKEQRRCEIKTIFLAWYVCHSPSAAAVFVKITDGINAPEKNTFWGLGVPPCNLCVLCSWGVQCRKSTAGCKHIRLLCCTGYVQQWHDVNTIQLTVFTLINVAKCGLELGHSYMNLLVLITTRSRPTYCVFTCLPCWVALLSSDSPSICLSRLMNGRRNICFLWRWWPTAATQRQKENECFDDQTSCITMTDNKWNRNCY